MVQPGEAERRRGGRAGRVPAVVLAAALAAGAGCANYDEMKREAVYGPSESLLEVVAVLRRHVPDDTYRFPPATDFTGRNVYRASLLRLENLELIHAEALRAGHMDAVMAFSKARALERLRAYDLAADHYRLAARRESALQDEAKRSAAFCQNIARAITLGFDRLDPLAKGSDALGPDPDEVVAAFEERVGELSMLLELSRMEGPGHYEFVIREEIERADELRAAYFVAMRFALPDGSVRAVAELQRVVSRHAPSKNRERHILVLADLYSDLAREYVEANPPESLSFDPPKFQEIVDAASHLYQSVAVRDGTPEKLEAARRFEAFLAFTLQVDRDRFSR
jgi:hypothetical protein